MRAYAALTSDCLTPSRPLPHTVTLKSRLQRASKYQRRARKRRLYRNACDWIAACAVACGFPASWMLHTSYTDGLALVTLVTALCVATLAQAYRP
jgi:hypothetical protein